MYEALPESTDTTMVVRFGGKVSGDDYQAFLEDLDARMKAGGPISLVLDLQDFEFYGDLESARLDMKFGLDEYRRIHRAAFVGDQKWIALVTKLMGPFTHAEEKQFPADQLAEAEVWASS